MKTLDDNGIEHVDGEAVALYDGKFSNTFLMENEDAAPIASGDLVTFIVTARAADPTFKHLKTGELKRLNPFKIEELLCFGVDGQDVLQVVLDAIQQHNAERTAEDLLRPNAPAQAVTIGGGIFDDDLFIAVEEEKEHEQVD